jgi:hypothetical protein
MEQQIRNFQQIMEFGVLLVVHKNQPLDPIVGPRIHSIPTTKSLRSMLYVTFPLYTQISWSHFF